MQATKIPYRVAISESHRKMLGEMAKQNRRTLQAELELLIEKANSGTVS